MNIIVTGSSGFIGTKLSERLIKEGHNVIGIDKKEGGYYTQYILDISDITFLEFDPKIKIDAIYHLAAQSGGYKSLVDPYIDSKWNCLGTVNLISVAKKLDIDKFIFISSMAIYGNNFLVSESTPANPISFYGVSKYSGELSVKLLKEHNDINYSVFRLFATYGSGQDLNNPHQGILSIYLNQILNSNEVRITGKKDRIRELIHVDDVINALFLGLQQETDNQTYNISNNEFITPEKIIKEIAFQLKKDIKIIELDGYVGDQTFITSKKSKLCNLGWSPLIDLKSGINEFLTNLNYE